MPLAHRKTKFLVVPINEKIRKFRVTVSVVVLLVTVFGSICACNAEHSRLIEPRYPYAIAEKWDQSFLSQQPQLIELARRNLERGIESTTIDSASRRNLGVVVSDFFADERGGWAIRGGLIDQKYFDDELYLLVGRQLQRWNLTGLDNSHVGSLDIFELEIIKPSHDGFEVIKPWTPLTGKTCEKMSCQLALFRLQNKLGTPIVTLDRNNSDSDS